MMRKTFKSTIPGFELNEEMAHKGKKKKISFSLFQYQNTKGRKTNWKKKKEPKNQKQKWKVTVYLQYSKFHMSETIIKCIFCSASTESPVTPWSLTEAAQVAQTSTIHTTEIYNVLEWLIGEIYR